MNLCLKFGMCGKPADELVNSEKQYTANFAIDKTTTRKKVLLVGDIGTQHDIRYSKLF